MAPPSPVDYAAIKHVLTHEHTENLHDRHIELIKQLCEARSQGFYVSELQDVCDVLAILHAKARTSPSVYENSLCAVVNICNQPLIEQKASELLRPAGLVMYSTFLNNVTQLLWLPNPALKMNVVAFIRRVAGGKLSTVDASQRPSNQDEDRPTDQSVARQLLRKSGAIGALADLFMSMAQAHLAAVRRFHEGIGALSTADDDDAEEHAIDAPLASADSLATSSQDELKTTLRGELASVSQLSSATIPTLLYLSEDEACAGVLVEHGLINSIAMLLGVVAEANRKQLADYVQILWNCCEGCEALQRPDNQQRPPFGASPVSPDVIDFHIVVSELVSLFVAIQHECFRKTYKAIRNEVLIVLGLLVRARQAVVELLRCQGMEAILTYSCAAEATAQWEGFLSPTASVRNFGTATELDVEMKGLLWALIIQVKAHNMHAVNLLIAESPFVQVLLEYVAGSCQELAAPDAMSVAPSEPQSLNLDDLSIRSPVLMRQGVDVTTQLLPTQVADLQLQAIAVLVKVCKYCVAEVRRLDGVATLLSVITEHSLQPERSSRLMVEYALIILAQLVEQSKLVVEELTSSDVVATCISGFHEYDGNCKIRALQLIVALSSSHRRQNVQAAFREAHGVHALAENLRAYCPRHAPLSPSRIAAATVTGTLGPASTAQLGSLTLSSIQPQLTAGPVSAAGDNVFGSEDELLLVAVLDCLWATVVGDERNEDVFLEANGVDDLLAAFEVVPAHMRPQVLALLSDLLERSETAAYVHGWRSTPTLRSFAQLLCAAWIDEEARLECFRPDGIIADLDHPLGCHAWDAAGSHASAGISVQSPAFARLNEALQASRAAVNDNKQEQAAEHADTGAEQRDIRCVLASVLEKLGYTQLQYLQHDVIGSEHRNSSEAGVAGLPSMLAKALQVSPEELGLSTSDKQVMVLARRYRILREGEGWKELQENLLRSKVVPITSDAQVMQQHLRTSFQQAQTVQFEQMQLLAEGRSGLEAQEQQFFGQILQQREALEKQAMLKSKMKPIKPRKVEPRRPAHVSFDMTSATASTILSYD